MREALMLAILEKPLSLLPAPFFERRGRNRPDLVPVAEVGPFPCVAPFSNGRSRISVCRGFWTFTETHQFFPRANHLVIFTTPSQRGGEVRSNSRHARDPRGWYVFWVKVLGPKNRSLPSKTKIGRDFDATVWQPCSCAGEQTGIKQTGRPRQRLTGLTFESRCSPNPPFSV